MKRAARFCVWLGAAALVAAGWGSGQAARAQGGVMLEADKTLLHVLKGTIWEVCQTKDGDKTTQAFGCGWVVRKKQKLAVVPYGVVGEADKIVAVFPAFEKDQLVNDPRTYEDKVNKAGGVGGAVVARDPKRNLALVQLDDVPAGAVELTLAASGAGPGQTVVAVSSVQGNGGKMWGAAQGKVAKAGAMKVTKQVELGADFEGRAVETQHFPAPGARGGPLVNGRGDLVGMLTATEAGGLEMSVDVSEIRAFLASKDVKALLGPAEEAAKPTPAPKAPAAKPAEEPAKPAAPADDADQAEQDAARKLRLAKSLADDGLVEKARARYEEIIKTYPKTKAAQEAKQLLDKLGK
jgi:S1-C subfamily serine protease